MIKHTKRNHRTSLIVALCLFFIVLLSGCGQEKNGTKVVLMTGFGKNEVFRIENKSCTVPEIKVYLTNTQNQYEEVFGAEIWQSTLDGVSLQDNVKDMVLAQAAQIKTLNLLAEKKSVKLSAEELERVSEAAKEYFASLNDTEKELLGVSEAIIEQMYKEYTLAQKLYAHIIKDINPEISDDEARIITVQHILIKTYTKDGSGKRVEYTEAAKTAAYRRAVEALNLATDGEHTFESVVAQYSEDAVATYSFGKGEMTEAFEEASFNLAMNEISGIVEDEYGYHIIKCMNTFNREETDQNKLKIVEERKKEVFGEEYDVFVDTLTRRLNDKVWEEIEFIHDEQVTTSSFFEVYKTYFPEYFQN